MKLSNLTDKMLLNEMNSLVQEEREVLARVLWHLREIDNRKLYADLKCSSLFDYCISVLKYTDGQAGRRVSACRMLKEMPEIAPMIETGKLNLTQLNQAQNFFKDEGVTAPEEKLEILEKIKDKSTRESDKILWELKKDAGPRKVNLQLNETTVEKLKEVKDLKAHSFQDMDTLLMKMAHVVSEIWDPELVKRKTNVVSSSTRYIPTQLKAHIWKRDQRKCRNCGSGHALEIDHIKPFARDGKTEENNLQLLCRNCNQRKAKKDFPRAFS